MKRKIIFLALLVTLVSVTAAEPWISGVNITPENPESGEEIQITATGEDSGRLVSLQANYGDGWESRYCDTFYICENNEDPWTFSLDESGSQEVRVRAVDDDYAYSEEVSRTVEVSSTTLDISSSNAEHLDDGEVEFSLILENNAPSDFSCRLSDNNRITTLDDPMDRDSDSEFSLTKNFDDGSYTRYFGCLNNEGELVTEVNSEDFEVDTDISYEIQNSNADHSGQGDVEFSVDLNSDLPSGYSCRWSENDRVTTIDEVMDRDSDSEFSLTKNFDDGSYTRYFGCLDDSGNLITEVADESFSVSTDDYTITDTEADKQGDGDVEFSVDLNSDLPSGYSCRWSENDRVTTVDDSMSRDSDDSFSAESSFDDGSHTVYFGCLDDSGNLITNTMEESFTIDVDEGSFFEVDITDTNSPIDSGEVLTVDYEVQNTGDEYDNQQIELDIAGSVKSSRNEGIFPGETETGTLRWYTSTSRSGTYSATVRSEDSSDSMSVTIGTTDYQIQDVDITKLGGNQIEFELETNRDLPSDYSCRWSENDRISTADQVMNRDSDDLFTALETFNDGSHTVYFGCLDDSNRLTTDVQSRSFSLDEGEFTLYLSSPLNGADRNPPFTMRWSSSGEGNIDHTVYVKDSDESGSLFRSTNREAFVGDDESYRFTRSLDPGLYNWGVEAESNTESIRRSATFRVPERTIEYDLEVNVQDERGNAIQSAIVTADSSSDETDSNGKSHFTLEEGSYRIVASKNGYLPDSRTISLNQDRQITMVLDSSASEDVAAEFNYNPSNPEVEETVEFDGSRSEGDIIDYNWRFGDGDTSSGRNVEHSYSSSGWYPVTLTVENSDGFTDSRTRVVRVGDEDEELGDLNVEVEDQNNNPVEDARVTTSALNPYNLAVRSVESDEDSERSSSSQVGNYRLGFELQDYELNTYAEYNSGYDEHSWSNSVRQSSSGDRIIVRYDLSADSRRNTYRKYEASQDLDLSSGEKEVTMVLSVNGDILEEYTSVIDVPSDHNFEAHNTGSDTEYSGTDTRVSTPSIPYFTRFTGSNGEVFFEIPEGRYLVTASKPGYVSDRTTVNVREDELRSVDLVLEDTRSERSEDGEVSEKDIQIQDASVPASVCKGESITARIDVENTGDDGDFALSITGLGSSLDRVYYLDEGESDTKSISLSNVQGSGNEIVSFSTGYDSEERTVQVRDCETQEEEGISASVSPKQIRIGSSVRVSGIADGSGTRNIDISVGGRSVTSLSTEPDGRFNTYILPNRVGNHEVRVETGSRSSSTMIEVLPTVSVNSVSVPNNVFEGQNFEVCGDVESQTAPLVLLRKDGQVVDSKNGKGDVCFELNEKPGTYRYQIQALNHGSSNTASRTLEVREQGSETSSFPDQIASVRSGSGMVKVELYNNRDELRTYELELEGLPRTWTAQSTKEVTLNSGERSTEYIYVTPKEEGTFEATLNVRSGGEEIYSDTVDISSGGRDRPQSIWQRFTSLFNF